MRENRTHGSEGGEGESLSRPLSKQWKSMGSDSIDPRSLMLASFILLVFEVNNGGVDQSSLTPLIHMTPLIHLVKGKSSGIVTPSSPALPPPAGEGSLFPLPQAGEG